MTGYGRLNETNEKFDVNIELKSLNSKFLDLRMRLPNNLKSKEHTIKKLITDRCFRGKFELTIDMVYLQNDEDSVINDRLFSRYIKELKRLSAEADYEGGDLIQAVLRVPNVLKAGSNDLDEQEWNEIKSLIARTADQLNNFRQTEGAALEDDLKSRIESIQEALPKVEIFEAERKTKVIARLEGAFAEYVNNESVDKNRFEQEILYYLEKIDINEEKVRLGQHCTYFLEIMAKKDVQKGRKLGFVAQEIGREINTLGAKAYSADIQRLVVSMKDDLEKIKEQVSNVL
jgi:uncharacterized protein (TIGR00255 family)